MPPIIKKTAGGTNYAIPFVGPVDHTLEVKVDISELSNTQVDADGVLKPGVVLPINGGALTAQSEGVMVYAPTKIAEGNTDLAASDEQPFVTCAVIAVANRYIVEDNLGRVLTADEIAALKVGKITLRS